MVISSDEKYSSFRKDLLLFENDADRVCAAVRKCLLQNRILHTLHFTFRKYETIQFYLHVFRNKTMLSYDLFPDNKKLLKKNVFCNIRSEKTNRVQNLFFEKSTKDRVSHINISVTVKRRSVDEHGKT